MQPEPKMHPLMRCSLIWKCLADQPLFPLISLRHHEDGIIVQHNISSAWIMSVLK